MSHLKRELLDLDIILTQIKEELREFETFTSVQRLAYGTLIDLREKFLTLHLVEKRLSSQELQNIQNLDSSFLPKLKRYNQHLEEINYYVGWEKRERARVGANKLVMADIGGDSHQKFLTILRDTKALIEEVKQLIPKVK